MNVPFPNCSNRTPCECRTPSRTALKIIAVRSFVLFGLQFTQLACSFWQIVRTQNKSQNISPSSHPYLFICVHRRPCVWKRACSTTVYCPQNNHGYTLLHGVLYTTPISYHRCPTLRANLKTLTLLYFTNVRFSSYSAIQSTQHSWNESSQMFDLLVCRRLITKYQYLTIIPLVGLCLILWQNWFLTILHKSHVLRDSAASFPRI